MDGGRTNTRSHYQRPSQDAYYNVYGTVRGNPTGRVRPSLPLDSSSKKPFNFFPWKKTKSKTDEFLQQPQTNLVRHDRYKFGSVSALSSANLYRDWNPPVPYGTPITASDLKQTLSRGENVRPRLNTAYSRDKFFTKNNDDVSNKPTFNQFSLSHVSGGKMKQGLVEDLSEELVRFKPTVCTCEKKKKSGPFGTLNFKSLRSSKCNCGFSSVRSSASFTVSTSPRRKSILPDKVDLYSVHEDKALNNNFISRPNNGRLGFNNEYGIYETPNIKNTSSSAKEKFFHTLSKSTKKDAFNSVASRKSILECDVTAYDLVKNYLNTTEEVDTDLDDDLSDNVIEGSLASRKNIALRTETKSNSKNDNKRHSVANDSPSPVSSESESGIYSQPPSIRIGGHGMKILDNNNGSHHSSLYSDCSKTNSVDSRTSSWSNGSTSDDGIYSLPEPDYDNDKDNYKTSLYEESTSSNYSNSPSYLRKYASRDSLTPLVTNLSNYRQYPSEAKETQKFSTVRRATSLVTLAPRIDVDPSRGFQPGRIPSIPEPPHYIAPVPPPPPPPPPPSFASHVNHSGSYVLEDNKDQTLSGPKTSKSPNLQQGSVSSCIAAELAEKLKSDKPLLRKMPMEVKPPISVNATNPYAEVKSILKKTSESKAPSEASTIEPSPISGVVYKVPALQEFQDKKKKRVQFKSLSNESLVIEHIVQHQSASSSEEELELNKSCIQRASNNDSSGCSTDKMKPEDGFQTVAEFLTTSRKNNVNISHLPRLSVKANINNNNKGNLTETGMKKCDIRTSRNGSIPRPSQPPPPPPIHSTKSTVPPSRPLGSTSKSLSYSDLRGNNSKFLDRSRNQGFIKTSIPISSRQQCLIPTTGFQSRIKSKPIEINNSGVQPQAPKNGLPSPAASLEDRTSTRGKSGTEGEPLIEFSCPQNNAPSQTSSYLEDEQSCDDSTIDGSSIYEDCRSVCEKDDIDEQISATQEDQWHHAVMNGDVSDDTQVKFLVEDDYDDTTSIYTITDDLEKCGDQEEISPVEPAMPSTLCPSLEFLNPYSYEIGRHNITPENDDFSDSEVSNAISDGTVYSNLLYVSCRNSPSPPPLPLCPPPIKVRHPAKVPPAPPQRHSTTVLSDFNGTETIYEQPNYGTRLDLPNARLGNASQQEAKNVVAKDKFEIYTSLRCSDTGATIVTISAGGDLGPPEHIYEELTNSNSNNLNPFGRHRRSFFEGASKAEILKYLEGAKDRVVHQIVEEDVESISLEEDDDEVTQSKNVSIQNLRNNPIRISNISSSSEASTLSSNSTISRSSNASEDREFDKLSRLVEIERKDSGVGTETSRPARVRKPAVCKDDELLCADCDQRITDTLQENMWCPLLCPKCDKKRSERKEIVTEIVETEVKYGKDLMIIREEFYSPMDVAALLSKDQLNSIFLNLNELILVNRQFSEKLKDAVDIAAEHGDEDYTTVNIGKLFLETSTMLQAFEVYCIQQGSASVLLSNLEKERELLRIFLKVSQMENTLLRRMNLSAFLMVPVQRVTKYPLLLNRLYKVTPYHHLDREALREAQLKIELHLDHINQQTKGITGTKIWRRLSNISAPHRRTVSVSDIGSIQFRKVAMEILQWSKEEIRFVMAGKLAFSAVPDFTRSRRGKTFKFSPSHALLATLGKPNSNYRPDTVNDATILFPKETGIRDATLLLMKEKNGKYSLARDPLHLGNCIISAELEDDEDDIIEIQEYTTKESLYLKAECKSEAVDWLKQLRYHAKDLGTWRRRRNALANIMINGMVR